MDSCSGSQVYTGTEAITLCSSHYAPPSTSLLHGNRARRAKLIYTLFTENYIKSRNSNMHGAGSASRIVVTCRRLIWWFVWWVNWERSGGWRLHSAHDRSHCYSFKMTGPKTLVVWCFRFPLCMVVCSELSSLLYDSVNLVRPHPPLSSKHHSTLSLNAHHICK